MNGPINWPTPKNAAATAMGKANPSRNTKPEVNLRRALHAEGFRFRKHYRVRDGNPRPPEVDIAFPGLKLAVQVHGVFWHGRKKDYRPKHNSEYWEKKFADNIARDKRVAKRLKAAGWTLCVVWDDWTLERQLRAVRRRHGQAAQLKGLHEVAPEIHGPGRDGIVVEQAPRVSSRGGRHRGIRPSVSHGL